MIANTDRKLAKLDTKLSVGSTTSGQEIDKPMNVNSLHLLNKNEEFVLKDSLVKLRQSFSPNHTSQYLINTLEQAFLTLIDRIEHTSSTGSNSSASNNFSDAPLVNTSSTPSSSVSSSLTSSSANSPVLPTIQPHQLSLSSSINSNSSSSASSSSSSSSSSSLSTVPISNNNNNLSDKPSQVDHDADLPIINNESNVKKIISRLLSQNSNTNINVNNSVGINTHFKQPIVNESVASMTRSATQLLDDTRQQISANKTGVSKSSNSSPSTGNMLLTIFSGNSGVKINGDSQEASAFQPHSSTKCLYYMDNKANSSPYLTTIAKR